MKSIIVGVAAAAGLMIAGSAVAADMPPEAKELNCIACHAVDHKVVGPAWADVGKKYKGVAKYKYSSSGSNAADAKEYPLVEGLVLKVSKGGSGNWGSMPMPANDPSGAKKAKIEKLIKFELSLG
jgi:cytochrome c